MRKSMYLLMIFGLFILGGCNLFSGLDKEDLDGSSFDYKLEESMASGDYATVVSLIDSKIVSTPELKAIDDALKVNEPDWTKEINYDDAKAYYEDLQGYYDENIGDPNLKEYIDLKLSSAEANLSLAGLTMVDIVKKISEAKGENKSKITKAEDEIKLGEIIPANLDRDYLTEAISNYIKVLPTSDVSYAKLREELENDYLNASLSSAISAVDRFIKIFDNPDIAGIQLKEWGTLNTEVATWGETWAITKLELEVARVYLGLYGQNSEVIDQEDLNEILGEIDAVILVTKEFTSVDDYNEFKTAIGY